MQLFVIDLLTVHTCFTTNNLTVMPIPEESQVMLQKIIKTEIYSYTG